jgi:hypothetical protein
MCVWCPLDRGAVAHSAGLGVVSDISADVAVAADTDTDKLLTLLALLLLTLALLLLLLPPGRM